MKKQPIGKTAEPVQYYHQRNERMNFMKKANQILWGIILVGIGLLLGLTALGVTSIDLFFDGWWTLFIIIPSAVGLVSDHDKTGNIIGLCIGIFLLLCCQNILNFDLLWKLLLPAIIVLIGVKMILGSFLDKNSAEAIKRIQAVNGEVSCGTAVFSGQNIDYSGEVFQGAELNAVFGGLKCDLRNALIQNDCVIEASAVFGGIDILVPANINIKISSNSIFGGISNKTANYTNETAPTLYIKGNCMFGGVDVK